jgi:hypothetical protein
MFMRIAGNPVTTKAGNPEPSVANLPDSGGGKSV